MGRRISKEFLHPSILEGVNDKIGNLDSLETDAKGNMVQAINELVEKLDNSAEIENGKELIANAVGEPLTAEHSFDEMSNDINSLLSTFKTNMMNNGITVNSSDKFKALIDKIATMVEEGNGKGIQYATGSVDMTKTTIYSPGFNGVSNPKSTTITTNLDFVPTLIFVELPKGIYSDDSDATTSQYNGMILNNIVSTGVYYTWMTMVTINNITANSFDIYAYITGTRTTDTLYLPESTITWYAIGVGEEDTTLRDSLADILENKGVIVTPEDDISNLITKVDSIDIHQPLTGSNIIYDNGTINTELTGGLFLAKPYSGDARCTFETDHIYVYPGANQASTSLTVNFRCRHPFSVYGYNKIKITYATRAFTVGSLKLKTEVYNWVSASTTSHDYTLSNPDSIGLNNTGGSSNITETTLNISDNTVPINIAIELKGVWNSNGPTQAGIYIHKIELLK